MAAERRLWVSGGVEGGQARWVTQFTAHGPEIKTSVSCGAKQPDGWASAAVFAFGD